MPEDHRELVVELAKENGWRRGIELGLGSGLLLQRLLTECPELTMIGVDIGLRFDRRQMHFAVQDKFSRRCEILHYSTRDAAGFVEDEWADFIFIDAAHSYGAVKDDIARWKPKLKPDGWFGGHDYHEMHPGVMRAVNEAFGASLKLLDHSVWVAA